MSFRSLLPSLCMLSLMLAACTSAPPLVEGPAASTVNVSDFLADVMTDDPLFSQSDLIARLGEPVRVKAEPANSSGTTTTAVYYGLEVCLHEEGSQSTVSWLALTDARHTSPDGLRVGLPQQHLLEMLGRPTRQTSTQLFYEKTEPRPMTLVITLEQKAASRLEWRFN